MQLVFVLGAVKTLPVWFFAELSFVRNLFDRTVYRRLPYQPSIRDTEDVRVIGRKGEALNLKSFTILPVSLLTNLLWHKFTIVPNF